MFTEAQLDVIKYCALEVKRQMDGPVEVYYMLNAWNYAAMKNEVWNLPYKPYQVDIDFIEQIGKLVEPNDNADGYRTTRVGVSNGYNWIEKAPPDRVIPQLNALLYSYYEGNLGIEHSDFWNKHSKSPEDQFYFNFEEIHPFADGNGRTGKIVYNYLKGTLDNPVMPPNFWGSSNP